MTALPGFGKQKAQIFIALLAKQLDVRPEGWEGVVGDYSLDGIGRWPTSSTTIAAEGACVQEGEEGRGPVLNRLSPDDTMGDARRG